MIFDINQAETAKGKVSVTEGGYGLEIAITTPSSTHTMAIDLYPPAVGEAYFQIIVDRTDSEDPLVVRIYDDGRVEVVQN